jgi:hypothetical protein
MQKTTNPNLNKILSGPTLSRPIAGGGTGFLGGGQVEFVTCFLIKILLIIFFINYSKNEIKKKY